MTRLVGDPLQIADWLLACHNAGTTVRMQINESTTPEEGTLNVTAPVDLTDSWYRQLDAAQAEELQLHRIHWPLMSQEEFDRRDLNNLLDELEQRQLFCKRDQLVTLVFSPVRKAGES